MSIFEIRDEVLKGLREVADPYGFKVDTDFGGGDLVVWVKYGDQHSDCDAHSISKIVDELRRRHVIEVWRGKIRARAKEMEMEAKA